MPRIARALTAAVLLAGAASAGAVVLNDEDRDGVKPTVAHVGGAMSPTQLAALERSLPPKAKAVARERREGQKKSRTAHRRLNGAEALELTRRAFPQLVSQPGFRAARPGNGMRLRRLNGQFESQIVTKKGKRLLAKSTTPLAVKDADGKLSPVDMTLKRTAAGDFAPRNSVAPVTLGSRADEGLHLQGADVSVAPAGARAAVGQQTADSVFYPNVYGPERDTDLVQAPSQAFGAQVHWVLRSPRASTRLPLDVGMPAGAKMRRAVPKKDIPGVQRSIEVYKGSKSLAYIGAPLAYDADGLTVPATAEIQGDQIVVHVEHDKGKYRWPIHVDPIASDGTRASVLRGAMETSSLQWRFDEYGTDQYEATAGDPAWNYGMIMGMPHYRWFPPSGSGAVWRFTAPPGTRTVETTFEGLHHHAFNYQGTPLSGTQQGLTTPGFGQWLNAANGYYNYTFYNPAGGGGNNAFGDGSDTRGYGAYSGVTHVFNCNGCHPEPGLGNGAQFHLYATSHRTPNPGAWIYTGGQSAFHKAQSVTAYLRDPSAPQLTNVKRTGPSTAPDLNQAPSSSWRDYGASTPSTKVTFDINDTGTGANDATATLTSSQGTRAITPSDYRTCGSNGHTDTCLTADLNYTPDEGTNTITITGRDKAGNPTAPYTYTERIDRTPPTINSSAAGGTLWNNRNQATDHRNETVTATTPDFTIPASAVTDTGSGVKDVEVRIKNNAGTLVHTGAATLQDNIWTWTNALTGIPDGPYTVQVVARDKVAPIGNTATLDFSVTIDRAGDVQVAREYDDAAGLNQTATEWLRSGTNVDARREAGGLISTKRMIACPANASAQCPEARFVVPTEPGETGNDGLTLVRGANSTDDRVPPVALSRDPLAASTPAATGLALSTVLQPWQTPPPGATTVSRIEQTETATIDEQQSTVVVRLWVDAASGLTLRRQRLVGGEPDSDTYYSYGSRLLQSELPAAHFEAGQGQAATQTIDYATRNTPEPASEDETDAERDVAEDEFRETFGLPKLADVDLSVLTEVQRLLGLNRWGVRLLPDELEEIGRRVTLGGALSDVTEYVADNSLQSTFAGAWLDNAAGGVLRVRFTEGASTHQNAISALVSIAGRLDLGTAPANVSLTTLKALQNTISSDDATLVADGLDVNSLRVNPVTQVVEVGTASPTPANEQLLASRYGPRAVLVQRAPMQLVNSTLRVRRPIGQMLAGLQIRRVTPEGTLEECSTAFSLKRGNQYRILTAGHCGQVGGLWEHFNGQRPTSDYVAGQRTSRLAGNVDVSLLQPIDNKYATRGVYHRPGTSDAITNVQRSARSGEYERGTPVCAVGFRKTPPRCGEILFPNVVEDFSNGANVVRLSEQVEMSTDRALLGGDSGGGVYGGRVAYGVVSSSNLNNRATFTPMTNILDRYDYSLYTGG